jgi:Tfp pilus assembly protein PilX
MKSLHSKPYILSSNQRGIAALVTVMTITLFLISVAFLVANVSRSGVLGQANEAHATRAQFLAEAGIQDALIRLARDSSSTDSFTIADGSSTVSVAITAGSPVIITATSTVLGAGGISVGRTLQATVTLDGDGKVISVSKINL